MPTAVGVNVSVPLALLVPLQAPLAVHVEPFVDHVTVALWPSVIEVGFTDTVTVAGGMLEPPP
ncbi:MAG TPA: hypothetical protein VK820_04150 [Steroidobacteraceae bacterium]|nr:hypothetical protein [Steroidobacteraceae bacterium]